MSIEKTTITNVKEGFNFLGAHIKKRDKVIVPVNINQGGEDRLKGRQRKTRRWSVLASIEQIIQKMTNLGFARR